MKVSIILPVWNHLYDLTMPWMDKMRQTQGDWELLVVDNGSTDGTQTYLKELAEEDKRIRVKLLPSNRGFGGGNNVGYRWARGSVICFISNDVIIGSPNWLNLMLESVVNHPNALMGPSLVDFNQLTAFDFKPTPYIAGWCVFAHKNVFKKIAPHYKLWDEDFGKAYFEDVWLSVQAVDNGFQLIEAPLNLEHLGSRSSDQINIPEQTETNQATFRNKMMVRHLKNNHQKRIVFFASGVPYGFLPDDFDGKGVGGAESSLMLLAKELADKGYRVEIYNRTETVGNFDGVIYRSIAEYEPSQYCDVFVLFRAWHPAVEVANASLKVFWSCDQYTDVEGVWEMKVFPEVDITICISKYHKKYIQENYKDHGKLEILELGVRWEDYEKLPEKQKDKIIFCSVPHRGLDHLAKYLPVIKERVPDLELVITSDFRLWGQATPNNEEYKTMLEKFPYVRFLGKIPREELVKEQLTSEIMAYPTNYYECFCISAMECMAAGAVPITSDLGALPTTVGEGGVVLSNSKLDTDFVDSVVELLTNSKKLEAYRKKGRSIAQKHDWKAVVNDWVALIERELSMPRKKKPSMGVANKTTMTAPVVSLPKFVMLRFKERVEFAINGRAFEAKPTTYKNQTVYQVEVPYELMPTAMQIVADAYGNIVAS